MPSDSPSEEQISEGVPPSVGRFRERLYSGLDCILAHGREILLYGGLIASYLICIYAGDEAIALIGDYWPILLGPVLGIDDPRTNPRIKFVGGIRGPQELVRLVDEKGFAVAFSMYPTTLDQLMAIADAGQIMPPKSTWFEPKLRTGLFSHVLD